MKHYPLVLKKHEKVWVVRDDLFPYGSKARFLNHYFSELDAHEVVYGGSPRWGFAQISIAALAKRHGKKATIFLPQSKQLSEYSLRAQSLGAKIVQVPMGFTKVCEARAREYAQKRGAFNLPRGLNIPEALVGIMSMVQKLEIEPDEVWTVASTGTLSRGLQLAWPKADFFAVQTGHKVGQHEVGRAGIVVHPQPFGRPAKLLPPFPSVPEYDAKAWQHIPKDGKKLRLFWNVGA